MAPLLSLEISVDDPCPAKELLGIPLGHLDVHNLSQSYSGAPMVGQVGSDISIVSYRMGPPTYKLVYKPL